MLRTHVTGIQAPISKTKVSLLCFYPLPRTANDVFRCLFLNDAWRKKGSTYCSATFGQNGKLNYECYHLAIKCTPQAEFVFAPLISDLHSVPTTPTRSLSSLDFGGLAFNLFGRIVQYVYNKNIVRTDIYNNKYHIVMYLHTVEKAEENPSETHSHSASAT